MKRVRLNINGVLLLDKPIGPSSNDALQRARRALNAAKAGHGGTLDPMASGLLPIAFGEATKFLHDLLDADKTYEATLCLGISTDTGDAEGQISGERPVTCEDAAIDAACRAFQGDIQQVPPMHSALKRDGKPLYAYAREGIVLEREARPVTIHSIEVIGIDRTDPQRPRVSLRTRVSKGTYIRTLGEDIGERLGCGAHLLALRRMAVGKLTIDHACTPEALEQVDPEARISMVGAVDMLLSSLPPVALVDSLADRFIQGQRLVLDNASRAPLANAPAGPVRVYRGDRLLGTALFAPPGLLAPQRVLATHHD